MNKQKQVTIVGGGVVGLACAYYLQRQGHAVKVIERDTISDSCASGNAGYVTPSHFIPLAAPGMIKKGLKWMFDPESPFYIHPKLDLSLMQWLWKFNQHCHTKHVNNVKATLYELCTASKQLHLELADSIGNSYQLKQNGIYVVTESDKVLQEELDIVRQAQALGLNASEVSVQTLRKNFPQMQLNVKGGIFFPEDAHLHPTEFLSALHQHLLAVGVEFTEGYEVISLNVKHSEVKSLECCSIEDGSIVHQEIEELVIAGGSWSPQLTKQLNLKVPIQAGKGYSVTIDKPWDIDTPIILSDAAVAITPFEHQIRFGGTMEFAGLDRSISARRVEGILKSVKRFIPNFDLTNVDRKIAWSGLRPCTPDGLPLVGRVPRISNAFLAAGHAMLGLTLAPVTGKIISQLISNQPEFHTDSEELPYKRWQQHLETKRFS